MSATGSGTYTVAQCDIASLLGDGRLGRVVATQREHTAEGTHRKEIITCTFSSGERRKLIVKYGTEDVVASHGHKRGVGYEARVYADLVPLLGVRVPTMLGSALADDGTACLAIEFLEGAVRVKKLSGADGMARAAEYAGAMHRSGPAVADRLSFLTRYDEAYYTGWADRTTERMAGSHRWIEQARDAYASRAAHFASQPRVPLHGEYYPKNVLWSNGAVYAVDWESAALGLGEIDLVTLTEGWPAETVEACRTAYVDARWHGRPPDDLEARLVFADAYIQFRWLGEFGPSPATEWRVARLKAAAGRLASP